jgi:aldehyde dehydrogenase (NAD+)
MSDNRLHPNLDPHALARELSNKLLIDGTLRPAVSGRSFAVVNPATGATIAEAAEGGAADVDLAVVAAKAAQKAWAKTASRERGRLVGECGRLLSAHSEELGRLIALETGKALRTESRIEASVVADIFTFYGGLGSELKGETVPFRPDMLTLTLREPIGVVGAIIPWNVPVMLMALKIAPALVAGNAVIVKAAEEAPLAALRACQIMNQVLPPGVFNLLTGDGPGCGAPLVAHKGVGKVTFTRQGQSCTAASRIFVHETVHDAFVDKLKGKVDAMVMGDPLDEKTDIGAIISRPQFDKVQSYIRIGEETTGMRALRCSAMPRDAALKDGLFVQPVIFTGGGNDNRLAREEIFGPVTCIIKFRDYEEALAAANDSEYGLAATIWTRDLKTALDASHRLEAGFVQVNQNLVVQANLSYGGVKNSGLGKEASLEAMLEHFTHKKTIIMNMA